MVTRLLLVHALSPLHAGTGQSTGAVDLAIARDRATGHPFVPGSSIKGSLRARATELEWGHDVTRIFGPQRDNASDHAGAFVVGDANLLLFPVRSIAGTFAWCTSPLLLRRFARDLRECTRSPLGPFPMPTDVGRCFLAPTTDLAVEARVIFEDLDFTADCHHEVDHLASRLGGLLFDGDDARFWRDFLSRHLCIVHDDAMSFLSEHATAITARVALDNDTKTVIDGALWTEESLPTETVLASLVGVTPNQKTGLDARAIITRLDKLLDSSIQLGGKATVGRGRCRMVLRGGDKS